MTARQRARADEQAPLHLVEPREDTLMVELDDLVEQLDALARRFEREQAWHWWFKGFTVAVVLVLLGILIGGGLVGWLW